MQEWFFSNMMCLKFVRILWCRNAVLSALLSNNVFIAANASANTNQIHETVVREAASSHERRHQHDQS